MHRHNVVAAELTEAREVKLQQRWYTRTAESREARLQQSGTEELLSQLNRETPGYSKGREQISITHSVKLTAERKGSKVSTVES